jgi:hypothetical protein
MVVIMFHAGLLRDELEFSPGVADQTSAEN